MILSVRVGVGVGVGVGVYERESTDARLDVLACVCRVPCACARWWLVVAFYKTEGEGMHSRCAHKHISQRNKRLLKRTRCFSVDFDQTHG